jgi:hypothetical protein
VGIESHSLGSSDGGGALAVVAPGNGTAFEEPCDDECDDELPPIALGPGKGTAALNATWALNGKMFWQVGHLMRAPPAGIFVSSMLSCVLQEGQETFMALLDSQPSF